MFRLKELRFKKNLSRNEVAEKLNIKPRTYLSYENNEREPNSEMLIALANFFDVSIDYLIGRTDNPQRIEYKRESSNKEHSTLLEEINDLSEDEKQDVIEYIKFKKTQRQ